MLSSNQRVVEDERIAHKGQQNEPVLFDRFVPFSSQESLICYEALLSRVSMRLSDTQKSTNRDLFMRR